MNTRGGGAPNSAFRPFAYPSSSQSQRIFHLYHVFAYLNKVACVYVCVCVYARATVAILAQVILVQSGALPAPVSSASGQAPSPPRGEGPLEFDEGPLS